MNSALLAEAAIHETSENYNSTISDIYEILKTLQSHLEMDVVFIGELTEDKRIIRHIVNVDGNSRLKEQSFDPKGNTYCNKIVSGELPPLIPNTKENQITRELPITKELAIGCYMGVPIKFSSGQIYGTLCCFKHIPDHNMRMRDLHLMHAFSKLAASKISRKIYIESRTTEIKNRIDDVLNNALINMVYQPVYDLRTNSVVTFEALARFDHPSKNTPDVWFRESREVGMGKDMELLAVKSALTSLRSFPPHINISINISPEYILSGDLEACIKESDISRLLIEITEHDKIEDYKKLNVAFERLRLMGARLAVDDVGAGHANFFHIIELQPDVIKLDMSLTRNIDKDFHRQSLAKALIAFSRSVETKIIAEGVETEQELNTLRMLDVDKVQGYFIGKPAPLEKALLLCR